MRKRIRDLDLDDISARVRSATDAAKDRACYSVLQDELDQNPRPDQRVDATRDRFALAALAATQAPEALRIHQPLVEAFVRIHHHPLAPKELPRLHVPGKPETDAGPRLRALADRHPELAWDKEIVRALLWRAIHEHPDHELDDSRPPWLMDWGQSSRAATCLIVFLTLEAFGILEGTDPKAEAARREMEQQTIELARNLRDAIDRYDDPDVVAQREAYEKAKHARIAAQLASFYVKTGQRESHESLDEAIGNMLRYFAHRIDAEASDVGNAETINQPLPSLDSGALVRLDLVAVSSSRELVLRITSPNGKTTKSLPLQRGSKLQMIAFLERSSTPNVIIAAIDELQRS